MDLIRPLGLAGIPCALAARPGALPVHSRFVRASFPWVDPVTDPDGFTDAVATFAERQTEPPVLFYEGDWDLLAISRDRDRLGALTRFTLPDAELVEEVLDKARFHRLARSLDLPVPEATEARPRIEPATGVQVPLPLVVKPLIRNSATWNDLAGGAKAVEVDSADDLHALWALLAQAGIDVLLQELVPGPETAVESYHAYVDSRGGVAGEFTGRKIRTQPARFGHSTAIETTRAPDVVELGREVLTRLGLLGPAKVDFKRAPDGSLKLLEINPRFNLWHHAGALAGVNLPAIAYADLTGRPRPAAAEARPGVRWCHPVTDFRARGAAGMPLGRWLAFVAGTRARSGLALDDLLPLAARALRRLRPRTPTS